MWRVIDVEAMDSELLSLNRDNMFHKCYSYYLFEIVLALFFFHVDIIGQQGSLRYNITGDYL